MSQSILSKRVLQSYFSFVFWKNQMQAKTSYHKAITITLSQFFKGHSIPKVELLILLTIDII